MKINFDITFTNRRSGQPVEDEYGKPMTLASASYAALTNSLKGDENQSGQDKHTCWKLAEKVVGGGVVDLKAEEIVRIKERLARAFSPLVSGPAWEHIDAEQEQKP